VVAARPRKALWLTRISCSAALVERSELRLSSRKAAYSSVAPQRSTGNNFLTDGAEVTSGNQLQVVRLVGDRAIAVGAHDGPLLQIENAGHLVRIFLIHANAVPLHCA
jgi:hypothetical protein